MALTPRPNVGVQASLLRRFRGLERNPIDARFTRRNSRLGSKPADRPIRASKRCSSAPIRSRLVRAAAGRRLVMIHTPRSNVRRASPPAAETAEHTNPNHNRTPRASARRRRSRDVSVSTGERSANSRPDSIWPCSWRTGGAHRPRAETRFRSRTGIRRADVVAGCVREQPRSTAAWGVDIVAALDQKCASSRDNGVAAIRALQKWAAGQIGRLVAFELGGVCESLTDLSTCRDSCGGVNGPRPARV